MNATWDELDPYIETFERARGSEPIADLRAFAPPPSHARHLDVLRELVCIDLEFGWAEGRPKPLSDYRKAFPSLFANPAHAREIAFEEYRLRRQSGERPNLGYYRNLGIDVTGWPTMQAVLV